MGEYTLQNEYIIEESIDYDENGEVLSYCFIKYDGSWADIITKLNKLKG